MKRSYTPHHHHQIPDDSVLQEIYRMWRRYLESCMFKYIIHSDHRHSCWEDDDDDNQEETRDNSRCLTEERSESTREKTLESVSFRGADIKKNQKKKKKEEKSIDTFEKLIRQSRHIWKHYLYDFYGCEECGRSHYCGPYQTTCPILQRASDSLCPFSGRVHSTIPQMPVGTYRDEIATRDNVKNTHLQKYGENNARRRRKGDQYDRWEHRTQTNKLVSTSVANQLLYQANGLAANSYKRSRLYNQAEDIITSQAIIKKGHVFDRLMKHVPSSSSSSSGSDTMIVDDDDILPDSEQHIEDYEYHITNKRTKNGHNTKRGSSSSLQMDVGTDEQGLFDNLSFFNDERSKKNSNQLSLVHMDGYDIQDHIDNDEDSSHDEKRNVNIPSRCFYHTAANIVHFPTIELEYDADYLNAYLAPTIDYIYKHRDIFDHMSQLTQSLNATLTQQPVRGTKRSHHAALCILNENERRVLTKYYPPKLPWPIMVYQQSKYRRLPHQIMLSVFIEKCFRYFRDCYTTITTTTTVTTWNTAILPPDCLEDYVIRIDRLFNMYNCFTVADETKIITSDISRLYTCAWLALTRLFVDPWCFDDELGIRAYVWSSDPYLSECYMHDFFKHIPSASTVDPVFANIHLTSSVANGFRSVKHLIQIKSGLGPYELYKFFNCIEVDTHDNDDIKC